jgi:hypothetical protein
MEKLIYVSFSLISVVLWSMEVSVITVVYVRESLSPCAIQLFWFLRKMVLGACVLIVEP